jgi:hypothetical protein
LNFKKIENMKKRLIYSAFVASLFLVTGCNTDFLDVEPTQFLTEDQLAEEGEINPELLAGTVSGIYTLMVNTATGGTTSHIDFGQKGYDVLSDFLSGDMALTSNAYGWYGGVAELQSTQNFANTNNYIAWRYYYRVIRSTNQVIATLGGNDNIPETQANKWLMGQAKALRAHSYFYLANLYAREYDAASLTLPLYIETGSIALPKSTTGEVYAQIVKDLTESISLLDNFDRSSKVQVNKYVAKGVLAYAYAAMGMDAEAKVVTQDIISNGGFTKMTKAQLTGGFNDVNNAPSWMWGFDLTPIQGLDLISWWGQIDLYTYSYAWAGDRKAIDKGLYDMIPTNDARRPQFSTAATSLLMPLNKFFHPNRAIGGQREITTDYVYMRVDEMYLLNAETAAKSGDEAGAKTRLKEFLDVRIPNSSYVDALSGQALLDEIYKQTRIEFWGEGKSYLALKRNKGKVTRGANHLFLAGQEFQYNDPKIMFKIPQAEILNNPLINEQN